jgi:hypothetical protein
MDDREQGGMTGATGSLTPSDPDDEFVPAETRELTDPDAARRITAETFRRGEDRGAHKTDPAGPPPADDQKPQQSRGGGYGSGGGLSDADPAYRMEERAVPQADEESRRPSGATPILGGDERHDPEEEHL